MKKIELSPDVFIIEDFLSPLECLEYIKFSESIGYQEATVTTPRGPRMIKGVRNNSRVIVKELDMAQELWSKLKPYLSELPDGSTPYAVNELFRFYKYEIGERFNTHRDGRFVRNSLEESRLTFMIYLNDEFNGGETEFENFTITPRTGTALIFTHELRHKGCMITDGVKYALRTDIMFSKKTM